VVLRMYMEILNVDAAFGVFFDPGKDRCMVIGRSQSEELDVGPSCAAWRRRTPRAGRPKSEEPARRRRAADPGADQGPSAGVGADQRPDVISVHTVTAATRMEEVAMILRAKGVTGLPVVEKEKIVGMISRRDFRKMRKNPRSHRRSKPTCRPRC